MDTSSIDQGRGSHLVEHDTDGSEGLVAVTKTDQRAWEAPELRLILRLLDGEPMELVSPCPEWCTGDGIGHRADENISDLSREHSVRELITVLQHLLKVGQKP